ncbi:spore gernimation protein GerPD [Virgibacillus profundi]|uniref:Spore gernimation protein GerPD n=1 Tax=Virgibacillus profundi TaxID=2024555 RepID=A0A2A2IDN2_9BACI|nr:spore gernimation protein GerPD [Virgibacillus profundi]PAV29240.1 spore gernimation protein GerPD [Virgibacillus profundi]PXY53409.1 spore gernimation protein GerPD [Virgibacillus profundi]
MNIEVHNWGLNVENVQVDNVAASSVFLIGDNEEMNLSSFFDTPPEAFTIGNIVPLAP